MWLLAIYLTLHVTLSLTSIQTFHLTYIIYKYMILYIDILMFYMSSVYLTFFCRSILHFIRCCEEAVFITPMKRMVKVKAPCCRWALCVLFGFCSKITSLLPNYAKSQTMQAKSTCFNSKIPFCYEQMFFFHSKIHCHGEVWFVHGRIFMNVLLFMVKVPIFSGELGALFWLKTRERRELIFQRETSQSTVSASLLCT